MKILIGLSGGVDSTVAALLLKQQGYELIGATMSIWGKGEEAVSSGHKNACYGPDELKSIEGAKQVASRLGIPYHVCNCVEQYEKYVLENFRTEYEKGRTPNPCVLCNSYIKFGALPQTAKLDGIEFDKFATGHYARIEEKDGKFLLKKGVAPKKDQSYFLYRLKQEQLKNLLLPLGGYTKEEIRKIAEDNGLEVAQKPDSQDFYGGDYNELLHLSEKPGNIVNPDGKILGKHKGIWNYTVGQRKGIGISSTEPLYVLELRKDTNEVVIGPVDKTFKKSLTAVNLSWVLDEPLTKEYRVTAKIRSTQQPVPAIVKPVDDNHIEVVFDDMQKSIAIGQSVVLYDGDIVLGGGIIDSAI